MVLIMPGYLIEQDYARLKAIMLEHYINNTPSYNSSYCTNAFNRPIQHPVTKEWAYKVPFLKGLPEVFHDRLVPFETMDANGWFPPPDQSVEG